MDKDTLQEIRLARLRKGYSQENMGHLLGIHQTTYSDIESGKRSDLAPELVDRIKALVDLPIHPPDGQALTGISHSAPENHDVLTALTEQLRRLNENLESYFIKRGGAAIKTERLLLAN
jgi:transcriptional regulator with XRE-family HTH domain